MKILAISVLILAALLVLRIFEEKSYVKKMRHHFASIYGKKPVNEEMDAVDRENIAIYYHRIKGQFPEEHLIDDITWEDLDMDRIFCRINTTVSSAGEQLLYSELHHVSLDKDQLHIREKIMQYFDENKKVRTDVQYMMHNLSKKPIHFYIPEYIDNLEEQKVGFVLVCKVLLCTLLFCILAAVVTRRPEAAVLAGIHFFINLAVYAMKKMKYELQMESLYGILRTVKTADKLAKTMPEDWLQAGKDIETLSPVSRMVTILENRRQSQMLGDINGLAADYLCGAFMWDFIIYDKVIRLLLANRESFMRLYGFIGEIDLCIAAASFRRSLENYCIPHFGNGKELRAEGIYHPLIEHAVANDFNCVKNMLITGSNASGKSTFIKAAAVNLILGQTIHTCTALAMTIPDVGVLTSMAVKDDVLSGESYYIREIRYLKRMIERSRGKRLVFCGIDEILRGTNTPERIAASFAILEFLNKRNCILMAASHDLELAERVEGLYDNYHFCESAEEGDVCFDYKLRRGISYTKNAIRLLEAVGFPEEIVERAQRLEGIDR